MLNKKSFKYLLSGLTMGLALQAMAETKEITFLFTDDDANYVTYMEGLAKQFSEANPDVTVKFLTTGYDAVMKQLPLQLAVGEGPDVAKMASKLDEFYLDMRPYMVDEVAYRKLHGDTLKYVSSSVGDKDAIYGYMASQTVNLPFVNKTLFEQAGVEIPKAGYTMNELVALAKQVADETGIDIPYTMDRSGHRFTGPAFGYGVQFLEGDQFIVADAALKQYLTDTKSWIESGAFPKEMWGAAGGSKYKNMGDEFVNGNVAAYFAGNWMINPFASKIGDDFEWEMLPAPCGDAACVTQPGQTAIVAFKHTKYPEATARFVEFLGNAENQRYIAENFLIITGAGLDDLQYQTDNENVKKSLATATDAARNNIPENVRVFQSSYGSDSIYSVLIKRVGQLVVDEMTIDETMAVIAKDVEQVNAEVVLKLASLEKKKAQSK